MTANSQLSTTEPKKKKKKKQTKQTTRTGTESQKWRSHGGLSAGRGRRENRGKGTGNKKHNWQAKNIQGEVNNSIGNGEAKELIYTTHGHGLREERWKAEGCRVEGNKGEEKMGKLQQHNQ